MTLDTRRISTALVATLGVASGLFCVVACSPSSDDASAYAPASTISLSEPSPLQERPDKPLRGRYELIPFAAHKMKPEGYHRELNPLIGAAQPKHPPGFDYAFENLIPQPDGSMIARTTGTTMAAFKWEREKEARRTEANYKVEATLPNLKPGMVVAPLWLFSEGAEPGENAHEWDFEFLHDRLELNLHNGMGGFLLDAIHRDFSGHRVLLEIDRRENAVTMRLADLTDGYTYQRTFTPESITAMAEAGNGPPDLRFPTAPMFPMMEYWISDAETWAGPAEYPAPGENWDMVLHGYSITPY